MRWGGWQKGPKSRQEVQDKQDKQKHILRYCETQKCILTNLTELRMQT